MREGDEKERKSTKGTNGEDTTGETCSIDDRYIDMAQVKQVDRARKVTHIRLQLLVTVAELSITTDRPCTQLLVILGLAA